MQRLTEPTQDAAPLETTQLPSASQQDDDIASIKAALRTRSGRVVKRIGVAPTETLPKKVTKLDKNDKQQQKLVQFIKKGPLSPKKNLSSPSKMQKVNEETPSTNIIKAFASKANANNVEKGLKTPTKQIIKGSTPLKQGDIKNLVRKELNFDEVKTKVTRSAKLQELKASLSRIQELEKTRKAQEERNRKLREGANVTASPAKKVLQLKEFDTIELEVLTR